MNSAQPNARGSARRRIQALLLLGTCLSLQHASLANQEARSDLNKLPNFIVILTDDLGWGASSVQIDPLIPESASDFYLTPHIAALTQAGMRFTQAYSAHPNCSPSRAALLTGRSPAALKMSDIVTRVSGIQYEGNRLIPPAHVEQLSSEESTLPELLKAAFPSYRAAHFGKWHLAGGGPEQHGFDASDGDTGNQHGNSKRNLPKNPKRCFSVTRRGMRWMERQVQAGNPFYLQVSHYAPHLNSQARPATLKRFQNLAPGARHQDVEFGSMLNDLDLAIGQLLRKVNKLGIADNTYVIFTSDNGTYPTKDLSNANGPLRGSKATVWEGGIRVPFVVRGPDIQAASLSRVPVVGMDILPTILQLAGVPSYPDKVEGGSLVPILRGQAQAKVTRPREELVFHWPHYMHAKHSKPDSTILLGNFKLHYFWESDEVQLFDLSKDLGETQNLAAERPALAAKLKGRLDAYLTEVQAQLPSPNPDYDVASDPALTKPTAVSQ